MAFDRGIDAIGDAGHLRFEGGLERRPGKPPYPFAMFVPPAFPGSAPVDEDVLGHDKRFAGPSQFHTRMERFS